MNRIRRFFGKRAVQYVTIAILAVLYALVYEIFVFPNDFAPSGMTGLITMAQYLLGYPSIWYLTLLVNLPMVAVAFFVLNRDYALKTLTFVLFNSMTYLLLDRVWIHALDGIKYIAEDTGGRMLAAIAGGFFNGVMFSLAIRAGGSTGGTDVIGGFVNHRKPEFDTVWIIFALNTVVATISFFVYGMKYEPVILCILYVLINSRIGSTILKGARSAVKFEIVTTHPEEIAQELISSIHHGCTVVPARGMYTHTERSMLICVVNRRQIADFEKIVRKYDDTFTFVSSINNTLGRFDRVK